MEDWKGTLTMKWKTGKGTLTMKWKTGKEH